MESEIATRIDAEFKQQELILLTPPYKHHSVVLFRRLYKNVKLSSAAERFRKYKDYLDDLVRREVITAEWAAKWKAVSPWPERHRSGGAGYHD